MEPLKHTQIVAAADNYLEFHHHEPEAYEHVRDVLDKFQHMAGLAVDRALEELECGAKIIQFPTSRTPNDAA